MFDPKWFQNNLIAIITMIGLGVLAVFNLIDKASSQKRTEVDKADDRLMGILQATVEQLQKKSELASQDLVDTRQRLVSLETENKVIKDIFQGRDDTMQNFMKQGFATMAQVPEMIRMVASTNENVSKLYDLMHQLIVAMASKETPEKV